NVGFAIASPQLILNEGVRVITMSIQFADVPAFTAAEITKLQNISFYTFEFTGQKGWIAFDSSKTVSVRNKATASTMISLPEAAVKVVITPDACSLECTLVLDETQSALFAYSSKVHKGTYNTSWPVVRMKLNNYDSSPTDANNDTDSVFPLLRDKTTSSVSVKVEVDKVKTLIIQNDQAKFDPSKPFFPFGVQPSQGSDFYIGSEEIFYKRLDKLELHLQWHEVEADLVSYYKPYDTVLLKTITGVSTPAATGITGMTSSASTPDKTNGVFTAELDYLSEKKWKGYSAANSNVSLFENYNAASNASGAKKEHVITVTPAAGESIFADLKRAASFDELKEYTNDVQRGFIRLVLNSPDFQHRIYPSVLMRAAVVSDLQGTVVPQPYTPLIKSIYANYSSTQVLENSVDGFYHIHPFGEDEIELPEGTEEGLIVPSFKINSDDDNVSVESQQEGMLFIALENANPDESVSMLVQVVEDSGDPDVAKPDKIYWSYLKENTWIKLQQSQVLTDTTNGFITSGIIKLAIPGDATSTSTIMTSGYTWLRASTLGNTAALCNVLDIQTQAVQASFANAGNDLNRLATPLAAVTISKLEQPLAEIKSVSQPFASYDGKLPELGNEYYRRVSERLHHKGRAINMWDYERIVLENFPSIYKVKCVNHNDYNCTNNAELRPGSVCVVVISNLRNQTQVDTLKPSTAIGTRDAIKTFLQKRCSRFVRMEVVNPTYEEIQVDFKVKFGMSFDADKGYYRNQLESDIRNFLAPWSSDLGADIVFGGKIHASYIINFIEEREYVDYITDFEMYRVQRNADKTIVSPRLGPFEEIAAQTARSVLVSAPTHNVNTNLTTV
ncbi:MAG: baseplate J/gp47 family protein, partial [Bacteroidia bacterium]